ncbi:MAG TPA: SRPBCC domain-containing protein [Streptosporangiaceae bacterium]|nr:SRPBCC domain-containing protein [Streptosporangiaceae bacterium]
MEFTYRRTHRASPGLLFDCLTQPEHLARFWGPDGTTTSSIVVDLRAGGAFETTMVSPGGQYTMRAVYLEVDRPARLAWSEPDTGMVTTITFTDLGDGLTEVVTHQASVPDAFGSPEARSGFETSLRRFDEYVAQMT